MSMKAFAVTCEKHFPGKVVYYAAETPEGAISEARFALMKIGRQVRRSEIRSMYAPEYDVVAAQSPGRACIDQKVAALDLV